ncbi:hypothetical protein GCM10009557_74330 [Virgisporangium ochraceum]
MSARPPLGRIRTTHLRANGGGAAEPAQPGRHRRPATPENDAPTPRIPAPRQPHESEATT